MKVKYIWDYKIVKKMGSDYAIKNRPVACFVSDKEGSVGISICNPKDACNKRLARKIAEGRMKKNDSAYSNKPLAELGGVTIPNRLVMCRDGLEHSLEFLVYQTIQFLRVAKQVGV